VLAQRHGQIERGGDVRITAQGAKITPTAELFLSLEGEHSLVIVEHDMKFVRVSRLLAERKTMAIVLVEQFYDFAAELADQYLVMERGEIVQRGRGKDMEADGVRRACRSDAGPDHGTCATACSTDPAAPGSKGIRMAMTFGQCAVRKAFGLAPSAAACTASGGNFSCWHCSQAQAAR
jgi:hypothetical protein